jgi:hypothetical protein
MKLLNPFRWWRRLSQKKRVAIIASLLLLFAGPEMVVYLAPAFDLALLIDAFGVAFFLSTAAFCLPIPFRPLWARMALLLRTTCRRALEGIARVAVALRRRRALLRFDDYWIEHKIVWGGIILVNGAGAFVAICVGSHWVRVLSRALR